jgi:hypothetical protein
MKTKIASIALTAIVLAACAGVAQSQTPAPRPTRVMVNKQLLWIDQEPIIVRSQGVRLVWEIAAEGYEFPDDGIVFPKAPKGEFVCKVGDKRQSFECFDRNSSTPPPAWHKYTIKLRRIGGGKDQPDPLDPWVVNDR